MSGSDESQCVHLWGPAEEVELPLGTLWSPLCNHCGAVKLEVENREHGRRRQAFMLRPMNRPVVPLTPAAEPEFNLGDARRAS